LSIINFDERGYYHVALYPNLVYGNI